MSHQCTCPCHSSKVAISHVAPCCMRCNVCGDQIRMECLKDHARACNPVEVMERRVGERLAVIEDTLVEALAFYADQGNWRDGVLAEDAGFRAREALSRLPVERAASVAA